MPKIDAWELYRKASIGHYGTERYDEFARLIIEECAKVADAHKGSAAKARAAKKLSRQPEGWMQEIYDEERGEDIAAERIAINLRALKP